jgi:hypothetical protein
MKKRQRPRSRADRIFQTIKHLPWYGLACTDWAGNAMMPTFIGLGPDLLNGIIDEDRDGTLPPGWYAVGRYIPATEKGMSDYGSLTVRSQGNWCLRSRDDRNITACGRDGLIVRFEGGGQS